MMQHGHNMGYHMGHHMGHQQVMATPAQLQELNFLTSMEKAGKDVESGFASLFKKQQLQDLSFLSSMESAGKDMGTAFKDLFSKKQAVVLIL